MLGRIKADVTSCKCSVYAQWLNILALPFLAAAFILALLPLSFSIVNAVICATAFFAIAALEWPPAWTPLLLRPMMVWVQGTTVRAGAGIVASAALLVAGVGVGGLSGRAVSGAAVLCTLASLLNSIAVIRKEDSSNWYTPACHVHAHLHSQVKPGADSII